MNKSELILRIKNSTNMNINTIKEGVNLFLDKISAALLAGDIIQIKGFGTFSLKQRNARMGYNPNSGRRYYIGQKQVPYFRSSGKLRAAMNARLENK